MSDSDQAAARPPYFYRAIALSTLERTVFVEEEGKTRVVLDGTEVRAHQERVSLVRDVGPEGAVQHVEVEIGTGREALREAIDALEAIDGYLREQAAGYAAPSEREPAGQVLEACRSYLEPMAGQVPEAAQLVARIVATVGGSRS